MTMLVYFLHSYGQNEFINSKSGNSIAVFDTYGRTFTNPLADVSGTPYLLDDWKPASLLIRDKDRFNNIPVKLDLVNQEVHFISQKGVEMILPAGLVREISILDSSTGRRVQYKFRGGYPALESQSDNTLYLILSQGKIPLLEYLRKKVRVQKNDVSGEVSKELVTYEDYYLDISGKLVPVKRSRDFFLDKMSDRKKEVEEFVQKNKLSYKSEADIKKIVDYYNSL